MKAARFPRLFLFVAALVMLIAAYSCVMSVMIGSN